MKIMNLTKDQIADLIRLPQSTLTAILNSATSLMQYLPMSEKWSKKYKDSIDCNNPKGFSQKAHCQGKKKKEEKVLEKWLDEAEKRVTRKNKSQDPKQHSDLYTDENPRGTIKGLGFVDGAKARQSVNKIKNSGKEHKHKMQAAMAMHQRARVAADRAKNPESKKNLHAAEKVYKAFIEKMKKITKKRQMKESVYDTKCPPGYRYDKKLRSCVPKKGVLYPYPFAYFGRANGSSNQSGQNTNGQQTGNGQTLSLIHI